MALQQRRRGRGRSIVAASASTPTAWTREERALGYPHRSLGEAVGNDNTTDSAGEKEGGSNCRDCC